MNLPLLGKSAGSDAGVTQPRALAMPARPIGFPAGPVPLPDVRGIAGRRLAVFGGTVLTVLLLAFLLLRAIMPDGLAIGDIVLVALFVPNVALTAFAAWTVALAIFGGAAGGPGAAAPPGWRPDSRTAVLVPVRNENVPEIRTRVDGLRADLARSGLGDDVDIFILSDSDDMRSIAAEENLIAAIGGGSMIFPPRVFYRRRLTNEQRKPGNISDWVRNWGADYDFMLVFDADSRMTAGRIAGLIRRMEDNPRLGLLQTAVRLTGGETRFGRLQELSSRLYGAAFAGGVASWTGTEGNYWGHNALIRVAAFAEAAGLPQLTGRAPFGGDILSHDFIEAAWLRRAGWAVEVDPDTRGTFEGGPQTLGDFHKRDRRWCQGNMQHLRILPAPGLHPVSRMHLLNGVMSYLAAPLWLALLFAVLVFQPSGALLWPTLGALTVLLAPRVLTVAALMRRRAGWRSRTVVLRAALGEFLLSTMLAPILLVRQTAAVISVLGGRDCGWKPAGGGSSALEDRPWLEPVLALGILLMAAAGAEQPGQWAIVLPIVLPLWIAPILTMWFDGMPFRATARPDTSPIPALLPVYAAVQR